MTRHEGARAFVHPARPDTYGRGKWWPTVRLIGAGFQAYPCGALTTSPVSLQEATRIAIEAADDYRKEQADRQGVWPGLTGPVDWGGITCSGCGASSWVPVSLDQGWTRRAQCVPCGAIHATWTAPGWRTAGLS